MAEPTEINSQVTDLVTTSNGKAKKTHKAHKPKTTRKAKKARKKK